MVFAEGQKFMFAKYGVTSACMLAMQINVCVNCVSAFTFFPTCILYMYVSQHTCTHLCASVCVLESRCVLYLVQGAFHHSDVSQQDD